jgi:hypothetical protein
MTGVAVRWPRHNADMRPQERLLALYRLAGLL